MSENNPLLNTILATVPRADWESMRDAFKPADLPLDMTILDAGEPLRRVHLPLSGVISCVATFENGATAEKATVGREGLLEVEAILGGSCALSRCVVQVPGHAVTLSYDAFQRFARTIPAFRGALMAYARAYLAQVSQSVACNAVHPVQARAARWLLTCDDRNGGAPFALTQEFLAMMLGASRPIVSKIARGFQDRGLIHYVRGQLAVTDRPGLEAESCQCYRLIRDAYKQRFGCDR